MKRGLRPHLIWGLLGVIAVPALWFAWSLPGALVMFGSIAMAFVLWYRLGPRGSWVALILMGVGMSGILGWQAVTGSRCPEGDTKVFIKEGKPPIGCTDVRASAGSMSIFFGLIALIGIAAPIYARSFDEPVDGDGPDHGLMPPLY